MGHRHKPNGRQLAQKATLIRRGKEAERKELRRQTLCCVQSGVWAQGGEEAAREAFRGELKLKSQIHPQLEAKGVSRAEGLPLTGPHATKADTETRESVTRHEACG